MDMIEWLTGWLQKDDTKIVYILILIIGANLIDFTMGFINAKFNKKVVFSSSKAIYGIARKMVLFILCVYFIPVALIIPHNIGLISLYTLFTGYLIAEINSILNHLKLADNDKESSVFADFIQSILKNFTK